MIYCVWYPAGGFGTYISSVLDRYGKNFVRPSESDFVFSPTGNSHLNEKVVPVYRDRIANRYQIKLDHSQGNYSVLIDNGVNSESTKFLSVFPNAHVIKICYDDKSWPTLVQTLIVKAMNKTLESEIMPDQNKWDCADDWAVREKYFLFLIENQLRCAWKPDDISTSLDVGQIWNYTSLVNFFSSIGIEVENFEHKHQKWQQANQQYFTPAHQAQYIVQCVKNRQEVDLTHITDLWQQAVVNYYVLLDFGVTVPANTYANWFQNTKQIWEMIDGL